MPKEKETNQKKIKKDLDIRFNLGYDESIKNEVGNQSNPFALTERENSSKKVLDKQVSLEYNEVIKNGIGN